MFNSAKEKLKAYTEITNYINSNINASISDKLYNKLYNLYFYIVTTCKKYNLDINIAIEQYSQDMDNIISQLSNVSTVDQSIVSNQLIHDTLSDLTRNYINSKTDDNKELLNFFIDYLSKGCTTSESTNAIYNLLRTVLVKVNFNKLITDSDYRSFVGKTLKPVEKELEKFNSK